MKVKNVLFSIVLSCTTPLYAAKSFSFEEIHKMPRSIEKDYYIWRFLSQKSTTESEAKKIIEEASHLNKKLSTAYRNKTGLAPEIKQVRRIATEAEKARWKSNYQKLQELKSGLPCLGKREPRNRMLSFQQLRH